jgi:dynein heavy chain
MDTAKRTPNLFDLQSEVENLQKNLASSNELLDQIMKGLNDYLSAKCLLFPRFFFLSNDELLSILSQVRGGQTAGNFNTKRSDYSSHHSQFLQP